jgi:hypothetical protein
MNRISVREMLENPLLMNSEYYGFYDWFCKESSLSSRFLKLLPKVQFLVNEGIIDQDNCYVWFKNNCPCNGSLYDDIRISRIDTEEFLGGICPSSGHNSLKNKTFVWVLVPEFRKYEFINWSSFKKDLKTNKGLKDLLVSVFNPPLS